MVLNGYPFWLEFKPSGSLLVTHARAGGAESEGGTESSRSFGRWGNRKKHVWNSGNHVVLLKWLVELVDHQMFLSISLDIHGIWVSTKHQRQPGLPGPWRLSQRPGAIWGFRNWTGGIRCHQLISMETSCLGFRMDDFPIAPPMATRCTCALEESASRTTSTPSKRVFRLCSSALAMF